MIRVIALLLFFAFFGVTPALLMKGKVEVVKGKVLVYRGGRVLQVVDDMNIYAGDRLESSRHGAAMLNLTDMGYLKLKPQTQLVFPDTDNAQIQVAEVRIVFGEIWTKVKKLEQGEIFQIQTPGSSTRISNAIASIGFDGRKKKASHSVIEGEVEVHRDENHYFLGAGEQLIIDQRDSSKSRRRKVDVYALNKEWKRAITIREKMGRKIRDSMRIRDPSEGVQDSEAPLVHIVTPAESTPLRSPRVIIEGTIYEDHLDRVILTVNGKILVDQNSSLKNLRHEALLQAGVNRIELKAIDRFGNVGKDEIEVKLADLPPSIRVFFPFDNFETGSRFVELQGIIDDPEIREISVYLNHRLIAKDRAIPTFQVPIILDIGENIIRVEATNQVGLKGTEEITVYTGTKSNVSIQFNDFF